MSNGVVTPERFASIKDADLKLNILFDTSLATQKALHDNIEESNKRFEAGNKRFQKIEKKALSSQIKDKGFSGGMGFIGGFIASWFKGS